MKRQPAERVRTASFSGRKTFLLRIVVSQALVGALLVILFSLFMFRQFTANSIREITGTSADGLRQSVRVFETLWDSTYRYMNKEFLTSGLLMDAQNLEDFDPVFSGEVFRYLGNMVYNSGLFHSVYIYNGMTDSFFSSLGPVKSSAEFYDQGLVSLMREHRLKVSAAASNAVAIRRMRLGNGIGPYEGAVLSVLYTDNDFHSAMIFNIDLQVLQNLVADKDASQSARLIVVTNEGTIVADSAGGAMPVRQPADSFLQAVDRSAAVGSAIREWDGTRWMLSWQRWRRQDNIDWWFVSAADYRLLFSGVRAFQQQVLLFAGVFVLLSLIVSWLFGRRVYQPVSSLLEKIRIRQPEPALSDSQSHESRKGVSELEYLSQTYDRLSSDVSRLLSFETAGRGLARRHCLLRMLHGEDVGSAEIARCLPDKPWLLASEGFCAIAVRFDDMPVLSKRHDTDDLALLRFGVLNIAGELFGAVMGVETCEVSEEWLCLILHVGDPTEVPTGQAGRIRDVLARIREACRTHLDISVSAGVGGEVALSGDIRTSWQQARQAADCRFTEGTGAIVFHADVRQRNDKTYRYPVELERELMEALRSGDTSRLETSLSRFCSEVAVYPAPEARLALAQLSIVVQRQIDGAIGVTCAPPMGMLAAPDSFETIDRLRDAWTADLGLVAECVRKKREARHDELLSKVRQHVEERFADVSLTVEALAEEAGLSPNYLRTLYKDAHGQSITDHIAALRFQEAKRLLRATDMPANRIAGLVGYQRGGYFYTAFRKATGMTPDEYRHAPDASGV